MKQPGGEAEGLINHGLGCGGTQVLVRTGTCFLLALHPSLPLTVLWPPRPCGGGHQALVKVVLVFFSPCAAGWNEEPRPERQTVRSAQGEQQSQVSNFLLHEERGPSL